MDPAAVHPLPQAAAPQHPAARGAFKEVLTQLKADGTQYSKVASVYEEYTQKNFGTLAITIARTNQTDGQDSGTETLTGINWYNPDNREISLGRICISESDKTPPRIEASIAEGNEGARYYYEEIRTDTMACNSEKLSMPPTTLLFSAPWETTAFTRPLEITAAPSAPSPLRATA